MAERDNADKIRELVEELWHQASVWDLDVPEDRAEMGAFSVPS